jgi:hypothetical protein
MILHLFTQVSEYSIEFMKLLGNNFNTSDHVIVFRSKTKENEARNVYPNVIFVTSRKEVLKVLPPLLKAATRIIFHSFPVSRSLFFWIRHRAIMPKATWAVWGQDAYWYKYCKKSAENRLYEFIRKSLIKKLDKIFCPIYSDYLYIVDHYKTPAHYVNGMYPIPTNFDRLRLLRNSIRERDCIHIQVGNSANPTNNTIEILEILANYKNSNIKIFCPVSYGDPEYAKQVIKMGDQLFGDKFTPLTHFLDKNAYAEFIADIDILIMNHQRQQGLGNIFSYLYLGKKVYIRSDNSSFTFFGQHEIQVYDTAQLYQSSNANDLFDLNLKVSERNMMKTETIVDLETITTGWAQILK